MEYFYPAIREENDPAAAAQIILNLFRGRVSIVGDAPLSIENMWQQQKADEKGFESLKVAAFRSVGIPARLNDNNQAELLVDGKWQLREQ